MECKDCRKEIPYGHIMECKSCGATFCSDCGEKNKRICPYCYSDVEIVG